MFHFRLAASLLVLLILFPCLASAQNEPWLGEYPKSDSSLGDLPKDDAAPRLVTRPANPAATSPSAAVMVPAGTKVLMVLESPLHSTSGTAGSGLYLRTLYPVIVDNRVVVPAYTLVQGVVERNKRPGHVDRTAEFRFRFTTLVFANNRVAPIAGALQSIPGSPIVRSKDKEGTVGTVDQGEPVLRNGAAGAVGGAIIGSVRHIGIGTYVGAGLGAALGIGSVLLHRGDSINLPPGAAVEMVLEAPLVLDPEQVAFNSQYVPPARNAAIAPSKTPNADPQPRKAPPRRAPSIWNYAGPWLLHR